MFLDRYATSGSDPRRAPAALAVVPYVEQTFGAWYVPGGLRRLGDALARCQDRGVRVCADAEVVEVTLSGGRVDGVALADGSRIDADVVVSDADATHLYRDLVTSPLASAARSRLRRATPSLSGFVLLLPSTGGRRGCAITQCFPRTRRGVRRHLRPRGIAGRRADGVRRGA